MGNLTVDNTFKLLTTFRYFVFFGDVCVWVMHIYLNIKTYFGHFISVFRGENTDSCNNFFSIKCLFMRLLNSIQIDQADVMLVCIVLSVGPCGTKQDLVMYLTNKYIVPKVIICKTKLEDAYKQVCYT